MAAIKSYSDLQQSKKLAEILPIESADMVIWGKDLDAIVATDAQKFMKCLKDRKMNYVPCWSLASLLGVLPYPQLSKDKLGSGKEGWMVSVYPDNCRYDSCWHDNPVDACYEMILKLHELKLM